MPKTIRYFFILHFYFRERLRKMGTVAGTVASFYSQISLVFLHKTFYLCIAKSKESYSQDCSISSNDKYGINLNYMAINKIL